ncbi:TPA: hypothetical protein HA318_02865, partial [Candidatus Micrarchaeota archaeon]|nr:hypothetical protein [Candidatus Micrarchaeota archaeon]
MRQITLAAERFDPKKGSTFAAYSRSSVVGAPAAVLDYAYANQRLNIENQVIHRVLEQHRLDQRKSMHSSAEDLAARALETERKRRKIRKEPSDEWKKHAENAAALAAQAKTERLHERLQEISKELRAIRAVKT